jgi:hypothetical protein
MDTPDAPAVASGLSPAAVAAAAASARRGAAAPSASSAPSSRRQVDSDTGLYMDELDFAPLSGNFGKIDMDTGLPLSGGSSNISSWW